jgi:hypothetical protein
MINRIHYRVQMKTDMQSAGVHLQIDEIEKCNSSSSRRYKHYITHHLHCQYKVWLNTPYYMTEK